MLSLIVARARNGAIGKDNDIPWQAPEDLRAFQRETLGGAVIMGRNTWQSLPFKPLKNRLNIVVSSDPMAAGGAEDVPVVSSPEAAIAHAKAAGYSRIYGIGGAGIYAALLPLADRLLVTEVDLDVADADAFFPPFRIARTGESEVDGHGEWLAINQILLREAAPRCVMGEYLRAVPQP